MQRLFTAVLLASAGLPMAVQATVTAGELAYGKEHGYYDWGFQTMRGLRGIGPIDLATHNNSHYIINRSNGTVIELTKRIGQGTQGAVFKGLVVKTGSLPTSYQEFIGKQVAVKLTDASPFDDANDNKSAGLRKELRIAKRLAGLGGAPMVEFSDPGRFTVSEYNPITLSDYKRDFDFGIPRSEVMRIGECLVKTVQSLHKRGIIHRDIKPANIMFTQVPWRECADIVFIDYGYSCQNVDAKDDDFCENAPPVFTFGFGSRGALKGSAPSYRDDLESVCYTLMDLLGEGVPWKPTRENVRKLRDYLGVFAEPLLLLLDKRPNYDKIIQSFHELSSYPGRK